MITKHNVEVCLSCIPVVLRLDCWGHSLRRSRSDSFHIFVGILFKQLQDATPVSAKTCSVYLLRTSAKYGLPFRERPLFRASVVSIPVSHALACSCNHPHLSSAA